MQDDATGTTMPVRDAVFRILRHYGMTTIFGNPGSTELPMFSDLPDDFRYVTGLQESVVVAMADGHALARRGPSFVNLHSAAGLGHAMGSVYSAYRNRAPVVITAGQQSRPLLAHDPFLFAQNPTELPQPYVKWAIEPTRAEDVPAAIARAIHIAMMPPQGPVFVSVPLDDWKQTCLMPPLRAVTAATVAAPADLDWLSSRLESAQDPVFVVGAGVDAGEGWDAVIALAEHHQAPVWVAPLASRCSFPESHPLFAGFLPANEQDIAARLAGHDLCLTMGAPVFTYHYEKPALVPPAGCEIVQLVDDPHQAAAAVAGRGIVAGIGPTLEALVARLPQAARPRRAGAILQRKAPDPVGGVISTPFALDMLHKLRPTDWIVAEEAPSARDAVHDHLPIDRAGGFFATASGGLGYALPAAVGISLAAPHGESRPVLALIGDGSSMYSVQAIWSAVEHQADVLFVILNNGGYAALKGFAGNLPVVGCTIGHLSLAAMAEAQGCPAQVVSAPEALEDVLRQAFAAKGPRLVEIMVARD